jgi:RNA polymerase sigma-70 factor (ECF subfamily)
MGGETRDDGELLREFLSTRREAAFEALVRRHHAMVLGVCVRTLGDAHAAEDVAQAVFLILAHHSPSPGP